MQNNSKQNTTKYLQELAKNASKVIFVYQVEAETFSFLSPSIEQLLDKPLESAGVSPATLLDAVHPEDRNYLIRNLQRWIKGGGAKELEFRVLGGEGKEKWVKLSDTTIVEEGKDQHILVGMLEDISAVKEHYALLEKFASKKDSILEILSHDLAGPLTNIKGISSLLAEEVRDYNNPDLLKMVGMIQKTSTRSVQLIREFVKQEFLASANSPFVKKRVNLVNKIRESMEQYRSSEENIAKTFSFTYQKEEIYAEVDDYKIMQAINNLISNSIKFSPDGSTISVHLEEKEQGVLIKIADNGIGIPEKYKDDLFEKFTRARRPGLKGEPSTGLGMSIIKTIVEWHNGRIWFDSKVNEGTTFYIELPKE